MRLLGMRQITVQCRLLASESTREQLWQLMAEKNTPLINELVMQISKDCGVNKV